MAHRISIHRINFLTVFFMVSGILQPIFLPPLLPNFQRTASLPQESLLNAPSELPASWPRPERPDNDAYSPFLDPTDLAIEQALNGIADAQLFNGSDVRRLEPLSSGSFSSQEVILPAASTPLDTLQPVNPARAPQVHIPEPKQSFDNAKWGISSPSDLNSLANQNKLDELETDASTLDQAHKVDTSAQTSSSPSLAKIRSKSKENSTDAAFQKTDGFLSTQKSTPLLYPTIVTSTTEHQSGTQENENDVFLPLILNGGDNVSTPAPTNPDPIDNGITIAADAGGTLLSPDQNASITFRASGLPGSITAVISEDRSVTLPPHFIQLGSKATVKAQWTGDSQWVNSLDPEAQPILQPGAAKPIPPQPRYWATVTYQLREGQAANNNMAVARWDQTTGTWAILPTQINTGTNVATAETDRLGTFVLIENIIASMTNRQASRQFREIGASAIGDEVIVDDDDDDADLSFQHFTAGISGTWKLIPCGAGGCWNGDAHWTYNRSSFNPGDINTPWDEARWTPNLTDVGYYRVWAWIPANNAYTTGATYEIHHAGQVTTKVINQAVVHGAWVPLDDVDFTAGGGEYVRLTDVVPEKGVAEVQIGFDAVKFEYFGTQPPPPLDTEPPVISLRRWLDGNGSVLIQAHVTDNVAVGEVVLIFNGVSIVMTPVGGDLYEAVMPVPSDQISDYQIVAVDTSYNVATFPPGSSLNLRGYLSHNVGWHNFACGSGSDPCNPGYQGHQGDPVNTANGNFTYHTTDLTVSGVGDTDIIIERGYNSLPNEETGVISYTLNGGTIQEAPFDVHPEPFGLNWTFPYGMHLLIMDNLLLQGVQVRYPDGHTASFTDNGDGTYTPVETRVYDTLTDDGAGYLLKRKDLTEYRFDSQGLLTSITDRNGNTLTLAYSGEQLTGLTNASGRTVTFDYNGAGLISDIYAPEGRHLHYQYNNGRLSSFTDGRGNVTTYEYDTDGRLTTIITPKGHAGLRLTYDGTLGRATSQTIGATEQYTFGYDTTNRVTTITDAFSNTTTHYYDQKWRLTKSEDAKGFFETYGYDANDHRISFEDRAGRVYNYTYDNRGNRLAEDGPLGHHRQWTYNSLDQATYQLEQVDSSTTRETYFDYDANGNLIKITNALADFSQITYDSRGLPTNVFDFNGNETVNTYDPTTGDLIETRNAEADTVSFTYDGLGRIKTMTDGRGFVYQYSYDGHDNLTDVDGPDGYHLGYEYDSNNNLAKEIDPNGGQTKYFYDSSVNLIEARNQLDFPTFYRYDAMNNLTEMEDAEQRIWSYDYDEVYNSVATHGPEDTHTFYVYNDVRNVTDITRCNGLPGDAACARTQVTHYVYDGLDRIVEMVENYQPGQAATADINVPTRYVYDLVDNLLELIDANGNSTLYQYDLLDRLIHQEDAEQQVTRYDYDAMGNLIRLTNPRAFETNFSYDGANRLKTLTDALANVWNYTYDANGNLETTTDPLNVITLNTYDSLDRLASITLNHVPGSANTVEQNVTTGFRYDLAGNLRFVDDPRGGYVTEHQYDAAFRRIVTIDAEGGLTRFGYDDVDNLTSVIDANGHETKYAYDGLSRRTTVTNPETHSVHFAYDRLGNLLKLTDARSFDTTFTYDGMNRLTLRVDALSGTWRTTYDATGNILGQLDANGHANNTYTYDNVYRLLTSTDAENHVTNYQYDENGNIRFLIDGNDHTTEYTYDALDRLATLTNAELETTGYRYDPLGNQTQLIEADGIVTLYAYDPLYRLAAVTQNFLPGQPESADVNVDTHYGYDEVGNLLSILNAEDNLTTFSYDGLNRLVQEVDALANTWDYQYDPVGNRTVRIDALRHRTDYQYYPDNQLKQINYHDGATVGYSYDENNNRLTMDDHLGTTTWLYDPLNRVTDVTDPFNRHLGYQYDPVGNRTGLTYADGRTVHYAYYDNNWLKEVTDPENNVTVYDRDGIGQMVRTLNPNSTLTEASYDKANRLLTLTNFHVSGSRKTNSAFTYTYNEVGHRIQMVAEYAWRKPNVIVTSDYSYDALRRLIRDADSEGRWTDYTFDRVGNRLTLTTNDDSLSPRPFDSKTLVYSYNDINQPLTVVGDTHPGQPSTRSEDNTAQALHAFRHEVAAQTGKHINPPASDTLLTMVDTLLSKLYGKPAPKQAEVAADITALRDQVIAGIDHHGIENSLLAKLDKAGQANSGVSGDLQTTTFTYDANGNRTNKEFPGPQGPKVQGTDYRYDLENRLLAAQDYQGNANGNRVDRAITTLAYDGNGRRLVKEYDPKTDGGGVKRTEYVFDGLDPVTEYNIWNPQYENFYRGDLGRILEMQHFPAGTQGQMFWYHYDGLGSTAGLTKHNGQSSHNYRYEPYGQIEMPPGNFTDPHNHYTFSGKEWDENTNLHYFGARHYDSEVGVWLTQDTYRGVTRNPRSLHRYQYVYNNPTNYVDAYGFTGESLWEKTKAFVGNNIKQAVHTITSPIRQYKEIRANYEVSGVYGTNEQVRQLNAQKQIAAEQHYQKTVAENYVRAVRSGNCDLQSYYERAMRTSQVFMSSYWRDYENGYRYHQADQAELRAAIQLGAMGIDFIPGVGDVKGFVEVFTGTDLVTGEELGYYRYLGLLFLSELKSVRKVDSSVDVGKSLVKSYEKQGYELTKSSTYRNKFIKEFGEESARSFKTLEIDHRLPESLAKEHPKAMVDAMDIIGVKSINDPKVLQAVERSVNRGDLNRVLNDFNRQFPNPTGEDIAQYFFGVGEEIQGVRLPNSF